MAGHLKGSPCSLATSTPLGRALRERRYRRVPRDLRAKVELQRRNGALTE